jgi:hypothetical protein
LAVEDFASDAFASDGFASEAFAAEGFAAAGFAAAFPLPFDPAPADAFPPDSFASVRFAGAPAAERAPPACAREPVPLPPPAAACAATNLKNRLCSPFLVVSCSRSARLFSSKIEKNSSHEISLSPSSCGPKSKRSKPPGRLFLVVCVTTEGPAAARFRPGLDAVVIASGFCVAHAPVLQLTAQAWPWHAASVRRMPDSFRNIYPKLT